MARPTMIRKPVDHRRRLPRTGLATPPPARCPRRRFSATQDVDTRMARTNIQLGPNDHRPRPHDIIGSIPPSAGSSTRALRRATTLASIQASAPLIAAPIPAPPRAGPTEAERDRLVVAATARVRDDMAAYEARYPLAVQVRERLGAQEWERLEFERSRFAHLSRVLREMDRVPACPPRRHLDSQLESMRVYIRSACGEHMEDLFRHYHASGSGTAMIREMFHRMPYMWFIYNLYSPFERRMRWAELADWMVWTLQHPSREPGWFGWVREGERVPLMRPPTDAVSRVWNAAMVEMIRDVVARIVAPAAP